MDSAVLRRVGVGRKGIEIDRSAIIKAAKALTIPTVTARNSFRIIKAGLSEYCTASEKIVSAVPPPLFRGEASLVQSEGMVAILQWLWEWQHSMQRKAIPQSCDR